MEESIGELCKSVTSFCNHLESSSDDLTQSVLRRPNPLDSASSTFVQCLNRRVTATSSDLDLLESMSLNTVSFEELLGHCNEVYKKNQIDIQEIEDHLSSFGHVPELEELEDEVSDDSSTPIMIKPKTFDADDILQDSLSLKDLGLSDACLATIASNTNNGVGSPKLLPEIVGDDEEDTKPDGKSFLIDLSKDDYDRLPSYIKTLSSWEDLLAAVEKMNSVLVQKPRTGNFFHQEEFTSMDLEGFKLDETSYFYQPSYTASYLLKAAAKPASIREQGTSLCATACTDELFGR